MLRGARRPLDWPDAQLPDGPLVLARDLAAVLRRPVPALLERQSMKRPSGPELFTWLAVTLTSVSLVLAAWWRV